MKRRAILVFLWGSGLLLPLLFTKMIITRAAHRLPTSTDLFPVAYLPFVAKDASCIGNVLLNGNFELGGTGWYTHTDGSGPKVHALIGTVADGFHPYLGRYAARLGGYEGVWDILTQTVTIPYQGRLSFWWWMKSYEMLPHHDRFAVRIYAPADTSLLILHDDQAVQQQWQQDVIDVSAYAGQTVTLAFEAYNDNYYFTWFDLDEVCLGSVAGD